MPEEKEIRYHNMMNKLSIELYALNGYEVDEGYEFKESFHPQERLMYAMAELAYRELYDFIVEDFE